MKNSFRFLAGLSAALSAVPFVVASSMTTKSVAEEALASSPTEPSFAPAGTPAPTAKIPEARSFEVSHVSYYSAPSGGNDRGSENSFVKQSTDDPSDDSNSGGNNNNRANIVIPSVAVPDAAATWTLVGVASLGLVTLARRWKLSRN